MTESASPGPLEGIVVVDLANARAELAGRILADLGATVVKVEPAEGAEARRLPPFDGRPEGHGESLYWATVGLGKRSVVADVRSAEGVEAVRALAAGADVFIESFDPGVAKSLGLGYGELAASNPGLVYVSVTPYGQDGPHAMRPASELSLEADGGLLGLQGDGDRPPVPVGYPQAAFHAGAQAAADAIVALNARAQSGRGQHLDVSTQAAIVWTLMNATGYPPNTGGDPPRTGAHRTDPPIELAPGVSFPLTWTCRDGYVLLSLTLSRLGGRTLGNLVRLIEAEGGLSPDLPPNWTEWVDTLSLTTPPETLLRARDEIARFLQTKTKDELVAFATHHKLLLAPIRNIDELSGERQLASRNYWRTIDGRLHPGAAVQLERTPMGPHLPAPALGADQGLLREPPCRSPRPAPGPRIARPFEGLKVADFAWVGVGPMIAKALADHGATVVHVESENYPDVLRLGPPHKDGVAGIDRSQFQANFNSSKLGLALDLSLEGGRRLAHRLIEWADVVLESFIPGVVAEFGFSYEDLSKGRPELIMLSTCLLGQTGPYATLRGFGTQGAALAGLHGITGWPDRPPAGTWGAYTDFVAPRYGVAAIAAAILERRQSGRGQHIDLGQVEAGIHFLEPLMLDWTVNGKRHGPAGHTSDRHCPHGVYRVAGEERYVALSAETKDQWLALAGLVPMPGILAAELDSVERRRAAGAAIDAAIAAWCQDQEPWACVERLVAAGVPAAVVQRPSDLYSDPQLAHRGFFVTCDHAVMGPTPYDGPVTIFSETPAQLTAAPTLGQHTDQVLRDLLGLSDDEILEFAVEGVFS